MAEIHVEKKRAPGPLTWIILVLVIIVIAAFAWWAWQLQREPEPVQTTIPQTTVTEVAPPDLVAFRV